MTLYTGENGILDDVIVWNRLGEYISVEFKEYINNDLLRTNVAMCGVLPMK